MAPGDSPRSPDQPTEQANGLTHRLPPGAAAIAAPVQFSQVCFAWPGARESLLADFSLTAEAAAVTAIVGPSGSGKSTLLRLAAGLLAPSAGTITAGPAGPGHRAYVFQSPTLLPWRTVSENVGLPLELAGKPDAAAVQDALSKVDLTHAAHLLPRQLSGGMQMRASLARALVTQPELLLLDEPFGALDALTRRQVQQVFQAAWQRAQATVLLVTHDIDEAVRLSDRVIAVGDSPLRVRADVPIPLSHPRGRHDPAVGALVEQIEGAL